MLQAQILLAKLGKNHYCESGRDGLSDIHVVYHLNLMTHCGTQLVVWVVVVVLIASYRELGITTASDLEVRLCDTRSFANGFTLIYQLKIYAKCMTQFVYNYSYGSEYFCFCNMHNMVQYYVY